jgi:hypothetical protein
MSADCSFYHVVQHHGCSENYGYLDQRDFQVPEKARKSPTGGKPAYDPLEITFDFGNIHKLLSAINIGMSGGVGIPVVFRGARSLRRFCRLRRLANEVFVVDGIYERDD